MLTRILGLILFIFVFPILVILSLIIFIDDGFPILFRQKRVGKNNKHFNIFKLRTMKKNTPDIATHEIDESLALYTNIGPILRKYSLDELAQLINIINGDMIFIGPRPALYNQEDLIKLRKKVKVDKLIPGITGWAQVNGRDNLTISQKVKMDEYYLNNKSFYLDVKIIIKTIKKVFFAEDISR